MAKRQCPPWQRTLPAAIAPLPAAILLATIALLCTTAFCDRYRTTLRAVGGALVAFVALDVALLGLLIVPGLLCGWPLILAAGLSLSRADFAVRALQGIHRG